MFAVCSLPYCRQEEVPWLARWYKCKKRYHILDVQPKMECQQRRIGNLERDPFYLGMKGGIVLLDNWRNKTAPQERLAVTTTNMRLTMQLTFDCHLRFTVTYASVLSAVAYALYGSVKCCVHYLSFVWNHRYLFGSFRVISLIAEPISTYRFAVLGVQPYGCRDKSYSILLGTFLGQLEHLIHIAPLQVQCSTPHKYHATSIEIGICSYSNRRIHFNQEVIFYLVSYPVHERICYLIQVTLGGRSRASASASSRRSLPCYKSRESCDLSFELCS